MRDSGQPDWRCGEIAWQFQLPDAMLHQAVRSLSGGWQTRVKLAALLLHDPNLLILDEPTNFLDLRTQMLLEEFLRKFDGGILVVSHDREFLKRTCTHTLELSRGQLEMFPGDVDAYLANLAERREHDRRVNATTLDQAQAARNVHRQESGQRQHRQPGPQQGQAAREADADRRRRRRGDRAVQLSRDRSRGKARRCAPSGWPSAIPIARSPATCRWRSSTASASASWATTARARRRSCARSADRSTRSPGSLKWGYGCQVGVYAQHVYTTLPEDRTVSDYLYRQAAPGTKDQQIKDVAGSFLFSGEMVEKQIRVLSGGERARLVLAGLLLEQHNVLVLDEPGNHLDVESVEALADALSSYPGHGDFHEPRPALHAARGDARDRSARRPRRQLPGQLRRLCLPRPQGARSRPPRRARHVQRRRLEEALRRRARFSGRGRTPSTHKLTGREERELEKRLKSLERKIAKLDDEKKELNAKLLEVVDAAEVEALARAARRGRRRGRDA